eukprot:TRINITY_DN25422_c0_g1_i1.p1 TRINITY_DN25422_c0_g1~~TRINITY_DN25422_c0_g1_i1.p1  ORF type:complete len:567 (-),score=115.92 TRINITY_DN25422_c0_g1_i1:19-1719(-)
MLRVLAVAALAPCLATDVSSGAMGRNTWAGTGMKVLKEPEVQEYYNFLKDYKEVPLRDFDKTKAPGVLRVKNLDDADFQQLIRDGIPFVIDDCLKGWDEKAAHKLTCKDYADRWPTGNMRAEYTTNQYHIRLKDPTWYTQVFPQRSNREHMAGENKIAGPYVWHVKDEEPLKTKRGVQSYWRVPYFLDSNFANKMEANESLELWFALAGGGTFTHADAYCESTMSMQFSGKKRWRIQALPKVNNFFDAESFGDEQIYNNKTHAQWTPETEFTVGPGQCFVFPTGYLHETFVDPKEAEPGCYTAITTQFVEPRQVNLYRSYLSRMSMTHYGMGEDCIRKVSSYGTLLLNLKYKKQPDEAQMRAHADKFIKTVDKNGDGQLDHDEMLAHFKTKQNAMMEEGHFRYGWYGLMKTKEMKQQHAKEAVVIWVKDALQWHDADKNGLLTSDELTSGFLQWTVVAYRSRMIQKMLNDIKSPVKFVQKATAFQKELLSQYYCDDVNACPVLDAFIEGSEKLAKDKRRARAVYEKLQGMWASDDKEGDDEELELVDRATGQKEKATVKDLQSQEL